MIKATRTCENATKSPSAAGSATCGSTIAIAKAGTAIASRPRCYRERGYDYRRNAIGITLPDQNELSPSESTSAPHATNIGCRAMRANA